MFRQLTDALLRRVYYPITAVISFDAQERLKGVVLMDSLFASADCVVVSGAVQVIVICSHPDGRQEMADEELILCHRIIAQGEGASVRVYIYNEDAGLLEVDITGELRYNDENAI